MMFGRKLAALSATLLLAAEPALAAAPCISRQQVADMTVALLPPMIDQARKTCGTRLPSAAFINTAAATEMSARFRAAAATRTASAADGLRKLSGMQMPEGVSDATMVQLMGETLPSMMFKDPNADVCSNLNGMLDALAPLTPDQAGKLIAAVFALADVKSPSICKP